MAQEKRKALQEAVKKIETATLQTGGERAIIEEIRQLDKAIPPIIESFEANLENRRASMLDCLDTQSWATIPEFTENPRAKIRHLAAKKLREFRTFNRAADEENRRKLLAEYNELAARLALSKSLDAVLALLHRMKFKAALEKCEEDLKTTAISHQSKKFASVAITGELQKALDQEFQALGIEHIRTKLKEQSMRGKMYHQLLLDLPKDHKLEEILSEGEQRVIALGSFLAELTLASHSCGIVFDDPVSSLDHKWRRRVAKRLAIESQRRQVIVFTHEIIFLDQLCDECAKLQMEPKVSFLEWGGENSGVVADGLPWIHKSFGDRIDTLEKNQNRLKKLPWPPNPSQELAGEITRMYSFLRATIERVVQNHVLNGTVQRFRDYIEISRLNAVVGIQQSEVDELIRLTQRCHDITEAHDSVSEKNEPPPTPDELKKDIEDLKKVVSEIKDRRKRASAAK